MKCAFLLQQLRPARLNPTLRGSKLPGTPQWPEHGELCRAGRMGGVGMGRQAAEAWDLKDAWRERGDQLWKCSQSKRWTSPKLLNLQPLTDGGIKLEAVGTQMRTPLRR